MSSPWLTIAESLVGITEKRGSVDNPKILEMSRLCGHGWVRDDETPWCAAFVGACLKLSGFKNSGALNARSYLHFGRRLKRPEKGCIVVFWRKKKSGPYGHVAFFDHKQGNSIYVLGGNQSGGGSEAVNVKAYPKGRVLGYFWPTETGPLPDQTSLPTILQLAPDQAPGHLLGGTGTDEDPDRGDLADWDWRDSDPDDDGIELEVGAKGPLVEALQTALVGLNYMLGTVDGEFGPLTRDAVLSFQANNDLPTTGIADSATLQALSNGKRRDLSQKRLTAKEHDLAAKGSRTINSAGWNKWLGIGAAVLGLFGITDKNSGFVDGAANAVKDAIRGGPVGEDAETAIAAAKAAARTAKETAAAARAAIEKVSSGGLIESVIDLGQAVLSSGSAGPWGIVAAAGLVVWRNARNVAKARLDDHVKGRNLHH